MTEEQKPEDLTSLEEQLAEEPESHTGRYLQRVLEKTVTPAPEPEPVPAD